MKIKKRNDRKLNAKLLIVSVAIIGVGALLFASAASQSISVEPESGQKSQNAIVFQDTTASGGSAVAFGGASPNCSPLENVGCTGLNSSGLYFKETFNANPANHLSVMNREDLLPRWYAQPTMENTSGFDIKPEPMLVQHDHNCGIPKSWPGGAWDGVTVPEGFKKITTFAESVFQCKDHLMTALNPPSGGTANGAVVLKPNHMLNLSKINSGEIPEAVVRVDVSTLSPSKGDWWDIWLSSWDEQVVAPADHGHHQVGPPKGNSLRLAVITLANGDKRWMHTFYENGSYKSGQTPLTPEFAPNIRPIVSISDTRRDLYEVRITKDRVKMVLKDPATGKLVTVDEFSMPSQGFLGNESVVQFVHANYEPEKDGKVGCCEPYQNKTIPATWHWDNVELYPAKEYEMIGTKEYMVYSASPSKTVNFNRPAPANARMLFSGISWLGTGDIKVSLNGGITYLQPEVVRDGPGNGPPPGDYTVRTYSINVPQGTQSVMITGANGGWPPFNENLVCKPIQDCWGSFNFHVIAKK